MKPAKNAPRFVRQKLNNTKEKALKNAQRRSTESLGLNSAKSGHGPMPSIELFQLENSPASHAVRNRLTQLGLDFIAHNVPSGHALKHDQLVQAGGKDQVPFLIDHVSGIKMYESTAIIAYLEKTYGDPAKSLLGRIVRELDTRIRSRADEIAWTLVTPVLYAREFNDEILAALRTVKGSLGFLRERIETAVNARKPISRGTGSNKASNNGGHSPSTRATVLSVVDAA
jgi:glutaredoxin 3